MPTVYLNEEEKRLLQLLGDEIFRNRGVGAAAPAQFDSWDEAKETLKHLRDKIERAEQ